MKEERKKNIIKILNSIWSLLILASLVMIVVFAFLKIDLITKQIVWYISCAVMISSFFKKEVTKSEYSLWGNAATILILAIFGGIFVINVYDTAFNWLWYAFTILGISLITVTVCFAVTSWKKSEKTKQIKINIFKNSVKMVSIYMLLDLFYMAFIIDNLVLKFILGVLTVLVILYSLSVSFLGDSKLPKWLLVQDFVIGIGLTIYLIFIIPESLPNLQAIVTAIVAAVYGGLLTLVGVAWTIRKGDKDRNEDLKRIKIERIEEETIKAKPYLQLIQPNDNVESIINVQISSKGEEIVKSYRDIYISNVGGLFIFESIACNDEIVDCPKKIIAKDDIVRLKLRNLGGALNGDSVDVKIYGRDVLNNSYSFKIINHLIKNKDCIIQFDSIELPILEKI